MPATQDILERDFPDTSPPRGEDIASHTKRTARESREQYDTCLAEMKMIARQLSDEDLNLNPTQCDALEERSKALEEKAGRLKFLFGRDWHNSSTGGISRNSPENKGVAGYGKLFGKRDDSALAQFDDAGFPTLAHFLSAINDARNKGKFDERLASLDMSAQAKGGKGNDAFGGFLVPDRFRAQLLQTADDETPWLAMRTTIEADGGNAVFPVLEDRNRQDGIAGIALQRIAENAKIEQTFPKLASRRSELSKAAGLASVSGELLTDAAVAPSEVLNEVFGRAVSQRRSLDFVSGSGVGEPMGFLNSPATFTVSKEGGQAAATINGTNVLKMRSRCFGFARAIWLAHPSTFEHVASTRIVGDESDVFLFRPARGEDVPDTLFGRPIFFHESAPVLGSKGDISLLVPSAYLYASGPILIDTSAHAAFDEYRTLFRVVLRDDGAPWTKETLKDAQNHEMSEFVTLEERD